MSVERGAGVSDVAVPTALSLDSALPLVCVCLRSLVGSGQRVQDRGR